ncbi:zinc finger protein 845-like [Culicoides brevitarsis]|uniref:zinc finger protein 845-like n=1 Tax=Culicoides brevitarsis TaxID=469753 RepID=UPI00307B1901
MDFESKESKNNHIIERHSENLIPCEKCGVKLLDKKALRTHLEVEHTENSQKLECSRCVGGIKFPNERVLALHQQQHVREDKVKKTIYCNLCERGFNYENSYKSHLKLHAENRLKACDICGKTIFFEYGRRISKHMMNHTKKQPEIFKCDKCGEEFTRKGALSKHLRKIHDRREKSCYKCGKLIEQYLMKRHLNFCNYGDLKCFHCPMVFSKPSERDKHTKQTHIGYNCRRCNIKFENSSQLEFHRRYNENHKNYKNLLNKRRSDQSVVYLQSSKGVFLCLKLLSFKKNLSPKKMDLDDKICRFCLSKTENPKNLLLETAFTNKALQIFTKIEISLENCLSTYVCRNCHDLILNFYEYYEAVNANQEILKNLSQQEAPSAGIFDDSLLETFFEGIIDLPEENVDSTWIFNDIPEKKTEENQLARLNFYELNELPLNYTMSYRCQICPAKENSKFSSKSKLKSHFVSVHSMEKTKAESDVDHLHPQCDICDKLIKVRHDHKFIHYNIRPYKCDLCGFATHTKEILKRHLQKHVSSSSSERCFHCKMDFSSISDRNEHIKTVHPSALSICDQCGEILYDKKSAETHKRHHQNTSKQFLCKRCPDGVRFPSEKVLLLHQKQHSAQDKSRKRLSCHLCERKFNDNAVFDTHLRYHAAGRIVPCEICGKSIADHENGSTSRHMKTHTDKVQSVKCEFCDEKFPNRQFLFHHRRKVHDPREQKCFHCGKIVPQHFMKQHLFYCKGEEPIKCLHCPMTFEKESERGLHTSKFHLGFNCRRCNMQFEGKSELKETSVEGPVSLGNHEKTEEI